MNPSSTEERKLKNRLVKNGLKTGIETILSTHISGGGGGVAEHMTTQVYKSGIHSGNRPWYNYRFIFVVKVFCYHYNISRPRKFSSRMKYVLEFVFIIHLTRPSIFLKFIYSNKCTFDLQKLVTAN